jgi:cold shock CspA family protein
MTVIPQIPYSGGIVESYNDRGGYGYIIPDEPDEPNERLLVHRKSLRSIDLVLQAGDRVIYKTEIIPRGKLASDVHLEMDKDASGAQEILEGVISELRSDKQFGFIDTPQYKRVFFHFSHLLEDKAPAIGAAVSFRSVRTDRGLQARDISLDAMVASPSTIAPVPVETQRPAANYLAQAIIARDSRRYGDARILYEKGMREAPTVQLITSYAAMEKNGNRKREAMRVYQAGIKIFPDNVKLREDAGLLAASDGQFDAAIDLLNGALQRARERRQTSKGVLIALARIYALRSGRHNLTKALEYFKEAQQSGRNRNLESEDLLTMNLVRIRLQHHRGQLVYDFITNARFKIIRAHLFEETTVGADIVIAVDNPELVESYGVSGNVLVRCFFKSDINRADLQDLDETIDAWGDSGLLDEQLAFIIVSDLPDNLQRTLFRRIEDRKRLEPAIVPFTQAHIETAVDSLAAIRGVLDQWLYRRDLFALNFPVVGKRFFGRDKPLAEVRDAIANSSPIGIFGLRKVGKTSLLKEVERRAAEAGDIVAFMDLLRLPADVSDPRWLYWKLGTVLREKTQRSRLPPFEWRLGGRFKDYFDIPKDFPVATAFDADLTHILKSIKASSIHPRPKVVLLLDEIERIVPTKLGKEGFHGYFDFLGYLRGVAQESEDFVTIIAGANASVAEASQFGGKDNPVFNFYKEIYLQLLQPKECTLMITSLGRGMGLRFPDDTCDLIYDLTGGHPFFARQLCSFLAERSKDRPFEVSVSFVNGLLDQYLEFAGKDFQEIIDRFSRDYPTERDVCVAIARASGHIKTDHVNMQLGKDGVSLKHLVGYQVVRFQEGEVRLTMDLMAKWLQRRLTDVIA